MIAAVGSVLLRAVWGWIIGARARRPRPIEVVPTVVGTSLLLVETFVLAAWGAMAWLGAAVVAGAVVHFALRWAFSRRPREAPAGVA